MPDNVVGFVFISILHGRTAQEEWQENGSLMLMTKACGNDILLVSKLRPSKEGLFLLPTKE